MQDRNGARSKRFLWRCRSCGEQGDFVPTSPGAPTILIVDDTPTNLDLLVEVLKSDYRTKVAISGEKALELVFSGVPPDLILLLNPDTVAQASAIDALVSFMELHPDVGLAGSRLENPDGTTQWAAKRFHTFFSELDDAVSFGPLSKLLNRWSIAHSEQSTPHPTDWVPGAALMIRREVFESIGLLDESYFLYFEEVDFCLRAKRAGFDCWYVPQSRVVHFVGQSTGVTSSRPGRRPRYWFESRARFWLTHYGRLHKLACDGAWTCGRLLFHLRCLFQGKRNHFPPHLWRDFVRFNFGSRDAWKL